MEREDCSEYVGGCAAVKLSVRPPLAVDDSLPCLRFIILVDYPQRNVGTHRTRGRSMAPDDENGSKKEDHYRGILRVNEIILFLHGDASRPMMISGNGPEVNQP